MKVKVFITFIVMIVFTTFGYADERSDRTLEMLRRLASNPSIWSGTVGANNIIRINNALEKAASLGPSENNLLYIAARSITTGITQEQYNALIGTNRHKYDNTYIPTMILMESGISPQLMVAIINVIMKQQPDRETGHYLYFTRLLNLQPDAASSLNLIGINHADFLANPNFNKSSGTNQSNNVDDLWQDISIVTLYFFKRLGEVGLEVTAPNDVFQNNIQLNLFVFLRETKNNYLSNLLNMMKTGNLNIKEYLNTPVPNDLVTILMGKRPIAVSFDKSLKIIILSYILNNPNLNITDQRLKKGIREAAPVLSEMYQVDNSIKNDVDTFYNDFINMYIRYGGK